jgi:protein arginine kinase activator
MNTCQACHERDAVVRLTQVVGDEVTTVHLCSKCAAERGIETEGELNQTPLGAFLAAVGKSGPDLAAAAATGELCSGCGATLQDFQASGRLGCARCWVTFERPLRDLVRRVQGATRHTGKGYQGSAAAAQTEPERQVRARGELKEQLNLAIEAEDFERAAQLRDQLRELPEG